MLLGYDEEIALGRAARPRPGTEPKAQARVQKTLAMGHMAWQLRCPLAWTLMPEESAKLREQLRRVDAGEWRPGLTDVFRLGELEERAVRLSARRRR
jgi:hypothetical protein